MAAEIHGRLVAVVRTAHVACVFAGIGLLLATGLMDALIGSRHVAETLALPLVHLGFGCVFCGVALSAARFFVEER